MDSLAAETKSEEPFVDRSADSKLRGAGTQFVLFASASNLSIIHLLTVRNAEKLEERNSFYVHYSMLC